MKTTQTKKLQTSQRSTQYSTADIGVSDEPEQGPPEKKEMGVQCSIIGGPLFLDEEDSDDDGMEYSDNSDDDPDWLPGDESTSSDDELEEIEDTM